jgi:hypothetical protein
MLAALCWLTMPAVAAAESWILWESVEEHRLHPVDSPFPSQPVCVSRGQARITQYRQQFKPPRPGAVAVAVDGGLTARVQWQETSDPREPAERSAEYRESLKPVLSFQEAELKRITERVEIRQGSGLSETDGERRDALRALVAAAQQRVDETRRRIAEADEQLAEANRQKPVTRWVGATTLRYQCWPVGVNPQ